MRVAFHNRVWPRPAARALTIMELLVSVAIMTVIVYGLYAMFAHTQKALRGNVTQVDIFDAGRAASEMVGRELEELAAAGVPNGVNLRVVRSGASLRQTELDDKTSLRTNAIQELFFLNSFTNRWTGIGYRVMDAIDGVGTLHRYASSVNVHNLGTNVLAARFDLNGPGSTNLHRVADGIIHFRLTAYDQLGLTLDQPGGFTNNSVLRLRSSDTVARAVGSDIVVRHDFDDARRSQTEFLFLSNSLPAYMELELGVLDPDTFKQYLSLRGTDLAQGFLRKRANKVHLFRQRIPIRTAVP